MDPRLQQLSYSSLLTLHSCPRKFQLYRMNVESMATTPVSESITFAYGHVVGEGIQLLLQKKSMEEVIWNTFIRWNCDLLDANPKQNKSFWEAIIAIEKFQHLFSTVKFLGDYELVYHNGKPACELSFRIHLPNGYMYRGYVDAVLRDPNTGQVLVLECKTSSATSLNAATYKNSAQAIGYSIVLDYLFPELSSYDVRYLVYLTKSREYEQLNFYKSYLQRALWLQELLLDTQIISHYENAEIFPMRGESCFTYFRECEYIGTCTLSTSRLTTPVPENFLAEILEEEYDVEISFEDLVEVQLSKV